ncbi:MAG: hypothetical protein EX271_08715 [Acidimicrobiales bacterium]|nr:hypothetical protein [Hyphomonadaceae bacterium]RZV41111.1 MAG: hypothetical protein EX271_08715 [Acidimicrobiales bacterium]
MRKTAIAACLLPLDGRKMQIGSAKVDFDGLLIESSAGHFPMEPKVMDLLQVLVDNHNAVMSRNDLIDAVWGVEFGGDERLSRAISLLRKALGDTRGNHTHIITIPRKGYRLIAELESGDQPQAEADTPEPEPEPAPSPFTELEIVELSPQPKRFFRFRTLGVMGLVIAGLLVAWISPVGNSISEIPQKRRMQTGLEYVENYTRKDAIPQAQLLFSSMLADNPDHAAPRAGLAMALIREYMHLERDPALLQRAKANAEAALRADKHLALSSIAVGWTTMFEGDYEAALKSYDRADILDPDSMFSLEGRIRTLFAKKEYEKAQKVLDKAISLYPEYAVFYLIAGNKLSDRDQNKLAESMFRHAITLTKDNPRAYAQLSHTLHHQGKTTEAIKVLQDGLEVNDAALLYSNLGALLFFQGQYAMSAEAFERSIDMTGDSHDYLYWANLADAYRWVPGKQKDAHAAYDRALQLLQNEYDNRRDGHTYLSRAALYNAKRGNLDQAQDLLNRIPISDTTPAVVFYRMSVAYEILADRTQALAMLKRAIDANYTMTEILNDPELAELRQDTEYHLLLAAQEKEQ